MRRLLTGFYFGFVRMLISMKYWISWKRNEIHDHYNNLVVVSTGAHTIILTSRKDIEIRILRTCLFILVEIIFTIRCGMA